MLVIGCPQPKHIDHGDHSLLREADDMDKDTGMIAEGSRVFYSCHTGYRFRDENGPPNMVCRRGQWQGILPSCGKFCRCNKAHE